MVQHLSIRVPWHDSGWNGCVCKWPERNQACRVLKNIAEKKDDHAETQCAGCKIGIDDIPNPPCVTESGAFMSDHTVCEKRSYPYTFDERYKHILPTDVLFAPYSFVGTPYKWTLKDKDNTSPNSRFYTGYDPKIEPKVGSNNWVSNGINQKRIFDYFYQDVKSKESLIVAYAKVVPFIEDSGRVIIGIGRVASVDELKNYDYSKTPDDKNKFQSYLWERQIGHTIRADQNDGFLFPFAEIQDYLRDNPGYNAENFIVIAPEEYREEFSYATEHLSHDALIQTLNKTISVLRNYEKLGIGITANWGKSIEWCENRLKEVWFDRGAYPGLGAVLSALGLPYGFDIAKALKLKYSDAELWDNICDGIDNLTELLPRAQKRIAMSLTKTQHEDFADRIDSDRNYLQLLSRISLSLKQASFLLDESFRNKLNYAQYITDVHTDKPEYMAGISANPYLLHEETYMLEPALQIGIGQVDIAMFPPDYVLEQYFGNEERIVNETDDPHRIRAIVTSILEHEAKKGSSLMLLNDVVEKVVMFRSDLPDIETKVQARTITSSRRTDFFGEMFSLLPINVITDSGDKPETALQLNRLRKICDVINYIVHERLGKINNINDDWDKQLNLVLQGEKSSNPEREKDSRDEKVAVIGKMAKTQISVLTGGAGTGKTTTLVALCKNKEIQSGRILILAPTGKARVVLSQKLREQDIDHTPKTLFQYLQATNHCDSHTWSYYLSNKKDPNVPDTVIVDECSMLTEEMFGALLETVQRAKRIILVGDPNQLPPIGTGKPFFELVQKLRDVPGQPNYANLLVSNRQKQSDDDAVRLDVELAKLFTEDLSQYVSDSIFEELAHDTENIEFIKCEDVTQLSALMNETLSKAIGITDVASFDLSLGGSVNNNGWMDFDNADKVDDWQILTPYRNNATSGSLFLNRDIHLNFRPSENPASTYKKIFTKHPLGNDAIVYGEKVINIRNQPQVAYNIATKSKCDGYVANGEVGIVRKIWQKTRTNNFKANVHEIIFSSQRDLAYSFPSKIPSEGESDIELAYALTVHKAQGSGFKTTIFVLIEPERGTDPFVTRELLYTALSRQSDKVYIIYNKDASELKKYSVPEYSDLARRKTNLFIAPVIQELKMGTFDRNLIHTTLQGERVRSKSEVIVADLLYNSDVKYEYEQELNLNGYDKPIKPDFTITKSDGCVVYWEHLGMLESYGYRKNWERKCKLYAENDITLENGRLITSRDVSGSINSLDIQELINKLLL